MTSTNGVLLDFTEHYDVTKAATALPALEQCVEELGEVLAAIDEQSKKQAAGSGAALAKKNALLTLGDATYEVARAVRACAADTSNDTLAGQVSFSLAELIRGADKTVIDRAELIRAAASEAINALAGYGVTTAKLAALTKKNEAFRKAQPAPRQRVNKSSAATKELRKLFKSARELLNERLDGLMVQYTRLPTRNFSINTRPRGCWWQRGKDSGEAGGRRGILGQGDPTGRAIQHRRASGDKA